MQRLFLIFLLGSTLAHANNVRSYVASYGNNSNACTRSAPCADFAVALSQTTPFGEVDALDSGDYAPFLISQPVTIDGGAGNLVTVTTGNNFGPCVNGGSGLYGICIDAYAIGNGYTVTLRNLSVNLWENCCGGIAVSTNHPYLRGFAPTPSVMIDHVQIGAYGGSGLVVTYGNVALRDSVITAGSLSGVLALGGTTSLENVEIRNCVFGVDAEAGTVSIRNSNLNQNGNAGVNVNNNASVMVDSSTVSNCTQNSAGNQCVGIAAGSSAAVQLSNVTVTGNVVGLLGPMVSFVNNRIYNNTTNVSGTLTSVYQK